MNKLKTDSNDWNARIKAIKSRNRFSVLLVPMDVSAGLLGTHVYDCRGYDAESSLRVVRNLLLYAGLRPSEKAAAARMARADRR